MNRIGLRAVAMFMLLASIGLAQDALTNDSVIKLAKAGIAEETIVNMVNTQPVAFTLGVDGLVALKGGGVSDKVINAMVLRSSGGAPATARGASNSVRLQSRTPVKLVTVKELSSGKAKSGETFDLLVDEDVVVNGVVAIPKGSRAVGRVTEAQQKKFSGPNGLLDLTVDSVDVGGQTVPLRGTLKKGGERIGFPKRGKDVELPAGSLINAMVDGDKDLSLGGTK